MFRILPIGLYGIKGFQRLYKNLDFEKIPEPVDRPMARHHCPEFRRNTSGKGHVQNSMIYNNSGALCLEVDHFSSMYIPVYIYIYIYVYMCVTSYLSLLYIYTSMYIYISYMMDRGAESVQSKAIISLSLYIYIHSSVRLTINELCIESEYDYGETNIQIVWSPRGD